jgi:PmbA protein
MLGETRTLDLLSKVLSKCKADQAEAIFLGRDLQLTRYANSYIHQNVAEHDQQIFLRLVFGQRIGAGSTNILTDDGIEGLVERVTEQAKHQPEVPDFKSLPGPKPIPSVRAYYESTANCHPNVRASGVKLICDLAAERGLVASGSFATSRGELAIVNSNGVNAYADATEAELTAVVMSDTSSGYAARLTANVDEIDPERIAREAIDKALRARNPVPIQPGSYPVVLEEYAVADMIGMLAYMGFGALAYQEGRSFMKLGQKITGDKVTIWDDGLDEHGLPVPFDFEGVPKRHLDLIVEGIAVGLAYDTLTASREAKESTGHALPGHLFPGGNPEGPLPTNLFMATGNDSRDDLAKDIDLGIWITRFHYTNVVHPVASIFTGMTRDGTFLIEKGEVTRPVRNMRFTQNILEALASCVRLSRSASLVRGPLGPTHVPALTLQTFNFSSVTQF